MTHSRSLTVLAASAAGLVLFAGSTLGSYAANGGPLLLGKSNSATKTTTLKTTGNGSALKLKTKKTAPPLKVNGTGLVKKLNVDQLDGKDSEALETTTWSYDLVATPVANSGRKFTFPDLPRGRYLVDLNVNADIPGGSRFTCYFYPDGAGGDGITHVLALATKFGTTNSWYGSASGELDTRILPDTYALYCEADVAMWTMPGTSDVASKVVFTRIDNYTAGTRTGGSF